MADSSCIPLTWHIFLIKHFIKSTLMWCMIFFCSLHQPAFVFYLCCLWPFILNPLRHSQKVLKTKLIFTQGDFVPVFSFPGAEWARSVSLVMTLSYSKMCSAFSFIFCIHPEDYSFTIPYNSIIIGELTVQKAWKMW